MGGRKERKKTQDLNKNTITLIAQDVEEVNEEWLSLFLSSFYLLFSIHKLTFLLNTLHPFDSRKKPSHNQGFIDQDEGRRHWAEEIHFLIISHAYILVYLLCPLSLFRK